jgi:tetratricopeptide (TPR) repeat protein
MSAPTSSEKLRLAFSYIDEASDEVDGAADASDPYERTAHRQTLKAKLEAARDLLAVLEREEPGITTPYTLETGSEITITVPLARAWSYCTEADVMMRCYEDWEAARELMERAIAIKNDDGNDHCKLALIHAERRELAAAEAAIDRAISLEPDNFDFKRVRNEIRRDIERREEDMKIKQKPILWTIKRWLS